MIHFREEAKLSKRVCIETSPKSESLIMDESSHQKKQKLADQADASKSFEIASKLIELGNSAQLREMLANDELSGVNMDNGSGKNLLVAASETGQLVCVRVLLDHLESSTTKLVDEKSASDYQGCGTAYMTRGKHRLIRLDRPVVSGNGDVRTESLVLSACNRRYHHLAARYYKDYETAEIEPDAIMSKYIYVDISNLFIEACKRGDIKQVEYLISMGADVNRVDYHGRNAAVLACVAGNVKLMEVLLKHGADVNTRVIKVNRDLKHDVDRDADASIMYTREYYEDESWYDDFEQDTYPSHFLFAWDSLLHTTFYSDDPAMMRLLLEHGADVHALDSDFQCVFRRVYESCDLRNLKLSFINVLLDYLFKGTFEVVELYGQYPLHCACANLDYPLIERMLQNGADVNIIDGNTGLVKLLVAAANRFNRADMSSVMRCVKLLLDYGADPTVTDVKGRSVFEYVEPGSELDALLREHAADQKPLLK